MQGFPNRLSILTQHRFINAGIPRATSAGLLQRMPFLLERFRPRLLLLCAGLADMKTGVPPDRTEWNLRQIVEIALREGVSVVIIAIPERRYLFTSPAPMYHRIAREYGLWVEDKALQKILYNQKFADEQYLLNSNGNRVFAEEMVAFLKRTGVLAAGTVKRDE